MTDPTFTDLALERLVRMNVPEGAAHSLLLQLGRALDGELDPLDLLVLQRAYIEVTMQIDEVFQPRSPLQQQLDYLEARRTYKESTGNDLPDWPIATRGTPTDNDLHALGW